MQERAQRKPSTPRLVAGHRLGIIAKLREVVQLLDFGIGNRRIVRVVREVARVLRVVGQVGNDADDAGDLARVDGPEACLWLDLDPTQAVGGCGSATGDTLRAGHTPARRRLSLQALLTAV